MFKLNRFLFFYPTWLKPGMWSRSRRLGFETVSAMCVSCPRRYFAQILQATLIK